MGRAIRSRFASEITVAYDLIACLCAGAAVNATNYALSNFDRVEFGGKENSSPIELNNGLRVSLIAPHIMVAFARNV